MQIGSVTDWLQTTIFGASALAAYWGLSAWKQEAVGRRKAELAEDILARFYEARDIFPVLRSPFSSPGEGATRQKNDDETEDLARHLDLLYVPFERYNYHREFFAQLQSKRYRFRAYFGEQADEPFVKLNKALNEFLVAARMRIVTYPPNEAVAAKVWQHEENDALQTLVVQAVEELEKICKPLLSDSSKN